MPRVQVKTLGERVATAGIHLGGGPERRKLEPFEVIDIDENFTLPDGTNLLDALWATGKIELTMDPATRPLDYKSAREAKVCSPTFHARGLDEERERDTALAAVALRLEKTVSVPEPAPDTPAKPTQPARRRKRSPKRALQQADLNDGATLSA